MDKKTKNLLISTIWEKEPTIICITKLNIDKIVLLVDEGKIKEEQQKSVDFIRTTFGTNIEIEEHPIEVYDVCKIAKNTVEIIEKHSESYNTFINVTTGRRTQTIGVMYGASVRSSSVEKLIYVTVETNEILELPILSQGLTKTKMEILKFLNANYSIAKIKEEKKKTSSIIYSHIRDLRDQGFVDNDNKLTLGGKIAIL